MDGLPELEVKQNQTTGIIEKHRIAPKLMSQGLELGYVGGIAHSHFQPQFSYKKKDIV